MNITILGIESSCDDTSAAVIENGVLLSNRIAGQKVHQEFGGVVPELASRAHQQNIVPVVETALKDAGRSKDQLTAIAYTRGPGLMGALLVGSSFAKGLALSLQIPLIDINHLHAHILSVFLAKKDENRSFPPFPFLCLLVSGGHTQLVIMRDYLEMEIIGQTIDDAAGEAFDKCAKVMGLPYPGGPMIDRLAREGNPAAYAFSKAVIKGLDFSFSGLKTSFLYFLRDQVKDDPDFVRHHEKDLCASMQSAIIESLTRKLIQASQETGIREIAVAGGVSANSGLRDAVHRIAGKQHWNVYIPEIQYATDNAAMIAISGYFKYLKGEFSTQDLTPAARLGRL